MTVRSQLHLADKTSTTSLNGLESVSHRESQTLNHFCCTFGGTCRETCTHVFQLTLLCAYLVGIRDSRGRSWPGQRLCAVWRVGGSIPEGREIFHTRPDRPWGRFRGQIGRGVSLTTHPTPHLEPSLRKSFFFPPLQCHHMFGGTSWFPSWLWR